MSFNEVKRVAKSKGRIIITSNRKVVEEVKQYCYNTDRTVTTFIIEACDLDNKIFPGSMSMAYLIAPAIGDVDSADSYKSFLNWMEDNKNDFQFITGMAYVDVVIIIFFHEEYSRKMFTEYFTENMLGIQLTDDYTLSDGVYEKVEDGIVLYPYHNTIPIYTIFTLYNISIFNDTDIRDALFYYGYATNEYTKTFLGQVGLDASIVKSPESVFQWRFT